MSPDLAAQFAALEQALVAARPEDAPALIGELERLKARLWARMTSAAASNGQPEARAEEPDRWLTPEEAAEFLGLTVAQLNRRRSLPRRKLGHRTVRYSLSALKRYLARGT